MTQLDFKNPDYQPIIQARTERLLNLRAKPKYIKPVLRHYETHPIDFIEDWMWTYDPRRKPTIMPFILWPRQKEYIYWLWDKFIEKEDALVEKSRDAGATYLNMAFSIWLWRFHRGVKISFGSRKEMLVDRLGDPDSIFEKGRMILKYMPPEVLPVGFNHDVHAPFLKILNPENGSAITGEAGDNIGRGGRSSMYFKDESAFYERPQRIEAALSQNSDVKIDVSTPNGNGNPFYTKRHSGKIPVFTFSWRDDPRKDDAWYQKQVDILDAVTVAQEIDIDYAASVEGICIPAKYVKAAIDLDIPAEGTKTAGLDVADEEGVDENVLIKRHGVVIRKEWIKHWKGIDTTLTARKAHGHCVVIDADILNYDSIGVGAGVRGELNSLRASKKIRVKYAAVNVGEKPTHGYFEPGKKNRDMFGNLKAQLYWEMRRRFERTYEHVTGIKKYPYDQLISIPNHPQLISETSQTKYGHNEAGQIVIETKKALKARGLKSPNFFEALLIAFAKGKLSTTELLSG